MHYFHRAAVDGPRAAEAGPSSEEPPTERDQHNDAASKPTQSHTRGAANGPRAANAGPTHKGTPDEINEIKAATPGLSQSPLTDGSEWRPETTPNGNTGRSNAEEASDSRGVTDAQKKCGFRNASS